MEFRLSFQPKPLPKRIQHTDKLLLIGSCFTEQIGQKLSNHKFRVLDNPHGILFNPLSICCSLESYIAPKMYQPETLFFQQELWGSWDHHTRFSDPDPLQAIQKINHSQQRAHAFLAEADWVVLTLGSAFVYEQSGQLVANCHKVPADKFQKRLAPVEEITSALEKTMAAVRRFRPDIKLLFTISPVRHLRDGFVENNRSKARLIQAVEQLTQSIADAYYFPAYELIIDDLRDYRFYAEDMVHPNYAATQYVWERFTETCLEPGMPALLKEIQQIRQAYLHKPAHPASEAHRQFLESHYHKTRALTERFPYLDFTDELTYFSGAQR
jgi:lysophospholipase L1-like esterase